jgi:hypothetical protein
METEYTQNVQKKRAFNKPKPIKLMQLANKRIKKPELQ